MRLRHILILCQLSALLLLGGCTNAPVVPSQAEPLPQNSSQDSARAAWIEQIIARDPLVISSLKPVLKPDLDNATRIAKLRKRDGGVLPAAYWELYEKNLEAMQYDLNHQHDAARVQYMDTYREQLQRLDPPTLQALATQPETLNENTRRQLNAQASDRISRYMQTSEQAFKAATEAHLKRMALMDRQYKVCARNRYCWDAPSKS